MATKVDVFQKYEDTEMKRMQLVYLADNGFSAEEITQWVDYAASTIKQYIRKFSDLLEKAKKTFYVITKKAKAQIIGKREWVYLFKFYDDADELICSKVGTTTRLPEVRMKEEIKYYADHNIPVARAEICSVIDCGKYPAEGAESHTRGAFIKKYPEAFCKNDRFFGVNISVNTFNKLVKEYLA